MDALQQEIIKLLADGGPMTPGKISNTLNSKGWDVSQDSVLDALRWLEAVSAVECLWRINKHEIQTDLTSS